jgi:hypothetical protein
MVAVTTLPQSRPLRDGSYVEVARVRGDEEYAAGQPYAVTVRPADLRID